MTDQKPLPQLPKESVQGSSALWIDARTHRGQLIRHFLTEVHDQDIEGRRDGWVYVLEEVLDEFGRHLSQGGWLASLKQGHIRRMRQGLDDREVVAEGEEKPLPPRPEETITRLQKLMRRRSKSGEGGHLLLCVTPSGRQPLEDGGFHLLPANIGCDFSPGSFIVQEDTVLYGLEGLEGEDDSWRLVGGTFTFKGVSRPNQHKMLRKVLRLAIYVHLSLLLEQHLLTAMHVHLTFPRPKLLTPFPSSPTKPSQNIPFPTETQSKPLRTSLIPSSVTNFFLKRGFSYRSQTIDPPPARSTGSMDLSIIPASPTAPNLEASPKPAEGLTAALRFRRFSFMGDRHFSLHQRTPSQQPPEDPAEAWAHPFAVALKRVEECKSLLSTSPGVTFAPPTVIVDLMEKAKHKEDGIHTDGGKRRLKGDERVALTSILGWEGKEAEGRGMSGIVGFVRHQEISMLCSMHVPPPAAPLTKAPKAVVSAPPAIGASSPTTSDPLQSPASNAGDAPTDALSPNAGPSTSTAPPQHVFFANLPQSGLAPCGKPHWVTYQYYSTRPGEDVVLGRWVQEYAAEFDAPCSEPGCLYPKGKHECRLIHDGVRIVVRATDLRNKEENTEEKVGGDEKSVKEDEDAKPPPRALDQDIEVWESCAMCNAATSKKKLDAGAYLFSFAKFLELLLYSPSLCTLTPQLCKHTSSPSLASASSLPASRLNIIRHFSIASIDITMALSTIDDVFEIRVPRLQIIRGADRVTPPSSSSGPKPRNQEKESAQKKVLRKEIRDWWQGVSEHIDKIELILNADEPTSKTLPRLPSVDDAYEIFNELETSPHTGRFPFVPHSTPNTPADRNRTDSYFAMVTPSTISTATQGSQTPTVPSKDEPELLLSKLRHNFQKIEQSLYSQLARTSEASLNDVRRSFLATGRGTQKRLKAWQKKHLGVAKSKVVGDLVADEPEWWGKGYHVLPGVNVIVREDDWGSIIAHTLSTTDYQLELANLSMIRTSSGSHSTPTAAEPSPSSFFSVATGYKLFTSSSKHQPDPDQEDVVWNEPEQFSAVISRKDHPRDPTSILSIRDVLRQKATTDQPASSSNTASRFGAPSNGTTSQVAAPQVSKSKPDVALNMEFADATLVSAPPEAAETAGALILQHQKSLEDAGVTAPSTSRTASIKSVSSNASDTEPAEPSALPSRITAASITSTDTEESKDTIKKPEHAKTASSVSSHPPEQVAAQSPPPPPPKDTLRRPPINGRANGPGHAPTPSTSTSTAPSAWKSTPDTTPQSEDTTPPPTTSGFVSHLAHGINSAMRLVMPASTSAPPPTPTRETLSRTGTPSTSTLRKHHALLAEITNFDERPHIKYDWTVGKRLKFSCTVYYAKQFDLLRKRYGIHDTFLSSLSRSMNWAATGGKSRSNFWKTTDDQFIIKTLVNAWNVADLQVLIELAPSYFRYMDATASRATVLVKLLGFYTIEIRNLESGTVQSKVDLLVMENLFYKQNISKTFDLKGIHGRKVKTHGDTTKTLFDGEWIEGQQRTLTLVRPHSKAVLHDAIKSDAEFLAKSNIMDYSLLLGIDEEKKNISCGLVDTIGSYTFAKTLEYKAKQGLQSGKEVTVMPPAEYQERFVNALEGYFVACPDKWSKPFDEEVKINSDPDLLPSVL